MARLHKTCLVLGALLLSLVLGACRNTPPQTSSSAQPAPQAATAPAPSQQPATAPAAAPAPPAPASSTAANSSASSLVVEGEHPGVRVAIQELKRTSNSVTLKIMFINDTDSSFSIGRSFAERVYADSDNGSISAVHLIDAVGKKKYFVVRDSEDVPLCSRRAPDVAAKSRSLLWIKFPAPPDDVQKITVEIPHFPPVEDVPITR